MSHQSRRNAALNGWRKPASISLEPERGCADCPSYAPVSEMKTQSDGRVTCKRCDRAAKDKASERAQLAFFGQ